MLPAYSHRPEDSEETLRSSVEVVAIFNRFLQTISDHWLRYPQSVIENISAQSLSVFSDYNDISAFPVWTCFALCDPEAKWLKNILYGHLSRTAFLIALENDPSLLKFCFKFCSKFVSEKNDLDFVCCQNPVFISEITHVLSFLSYLLQYCNGRKVFNSDFCGGIVTCWSEALENMMKSGYSLCRTACLNCCLAVCSVISKTWCSLWNQDINLDCYANLLKILVSTFTDIQQSDLNCINFAIQCISYSFEGVVGTSSSKLNLNFEHFIVKLMNYCSASLTKSANITLADFCIQKHLLVLVKSFLSTPSSLFLNCNFFESLCNWLKNINKKSTSEILCRKSSAVAGSNIVDVVEQNFFDVNVALLKKPLGLALILDSSNFEITLNILLEKLLKDIKTKKSVCVNDIATLALALNSNILIEPVLNRTIIFRLSSIIWQSIETNDCGDLSEIKSILEMLMPSIFLDIVCLNDMEIQDTEAQLLQDLLILPKLTDAHVFSEECNILALKLLALLTTNVQVVCCLEAEYCLSKLLLEQQSQHVAIDGKPVVDLEFILRNYVLVKIYVFGGPNERTLPNEEINDSEDYKWPVVDSFPISDVFCNPVTVSAESELKFSKQIHRSVESEVEFSNPAICGAESDVEFRNPANCGTESDVEFSNLVNCSAESKVNFSEHVNSTESVDFKPISSAESGLELNGATQLLQLQETFLKHLKTSGVLPVQFCINVFQHFSNIQNANVCDLECTHSLPSENTDCLLSKTELIGVALVKRYRSILKIGNSEENGKLEQILKASKSLTGSKSDKIDLFVCTVYLLCCEDVDLVWTFLRNFSKTNSSFFMWSAQFSDNPETLQLYRKAYSMILEVTDIIAKESLPHVFSVLQFFGVLPSTLYSYWTRQCYWNYLDFSEISSFVLLGVLYSGMFSVYFFISVLKHLQNYIISNAYESCLIANLKKNPILNFKLEDYVDYIMELSTAFSHLESYLLPVVKSFYC